MNVEIQNTPQNIVSLVTPKLKLLPEFFSDIVPASASGEKVGFMNTVGLPLRFIDVATEIVARQDLNGYDHPWVSGGNGIQQWDEVWEAGGIDTDGSDVPSPTRFRTKNYIPVLPSTTYYLKSTQTLGFRYYDENKNFLSTFFPSLNSAFTTPNNAAYLRFVCTTSNTYNHDISVNYPSTNHDYYPWANICPITGFNTGNIIVSPTENQGDGTTYIVAWHSEAGTVYGGEVDVTKGKLTVTHKYQQVTSSLLTNNGKVSAQSLFLGAVTSLSDKKYGASNFLCDTFKVVASGYGNWTAIGRSNSTTIEFRFPYDGIGLTDEDTSATMLANAKTWLDNNAVYVAYELATPVEYDISPVAIKMLNGQNFIWSNTGDISVVYYKKVGVNDNVQTLMRSVAPSLGMTRQEVEDRPLADIVADLSGISALHSLVNDEREPIEREEIEDEPAEITEEEPQDEEPVEEETEEPVEEPQEEQR